ncbi:uncharacterized protein LOC100845213 isoform X1 [Brachypodium distachyon]|uniref:Uncharacterized protein n=1 Tax=Brachypodium distachyon TaxID=15368 RepID=I1IAL1_BRADI|nr:uncharacterized protein LOC100845213 isoform X1 [Brachypodium distachyon]KQJ99913.1 hypothetical protein BRADI_3g45990v3 [Brachypodium distachyon]|eukprot:XP_003575156.1 uncharacterized protein LOC100845213 isoform X1 [Brachypodium distachyon]
MEDGGSDFSDWEVLSAAEGDGDVVLVSGEGGDVVHDHFALDSPPPADFSGEDSWSEAASDKDEDEAGLGLLDSFDSIPQERMDLIAVVDSSAQPQSGAVDVTAQGSVLRVPVVFDAACGAEEEEIEALGAEIDHDEVDAARRCGELDSVPQAAHQAVEGTLDLDATAVTGEEFQIELSENYSVQLEDGAGADVNRESSVHEAAATSDAMHTAQEEPEQGKDAGAASDCADESDGSSPLVETPGTGEGKSRLVVWWRLPIKLLHYYAWKVRPVWSISIAAAFLGIVVLGRRMYRMRRKTQGLPQIKIAFDDKSASQFAERTARLNEAFLIAKRVPALRTSSGAALPWSMFQER